MSAPGAPKSKKTVAKTADLEPMKGLTPVKPGYMTPKKETGVGSPEYSPAKEVDLGEELPEEKKGEMAEIGSRNEEVRRGLLEEEKKMKTGKGRKSRKHKKSKKSRKTRKVKKHGKRRA